MPTRTEVDAAHKSIYTQRRELRALKHALAEANSRIARLEAALAEQPATVPADASASAPSSTADRPRAKSSASKPAAKKPSTRKSTTGRSTKSRTSKQESED